MLFSRLLFLGQFVLELLLADLSGLQVVLQDLLLHDQIVQGELLVIILFHFECLFILFECGGIFREHLLQFELQHLVCTQFIRLADHTTALQHLLGLVELFLCRQQTHAQIDEQRGIEFAFRTQLKHCRLGAANTSVAWSMRASVSHLRALSHSAQQFVFELQQLVGLRQWIEDDLHVVVSVFVVHKALIEQQFEIGTRAVEYLELLIGFVVVVRCNLHLFSAREERRVLIGW